MQPASSRGPARANVVCLAGFMGSGKTTVGAVLARQLGWRFIDLDERIEETAGLRIPEIFERFGEPGFRRMEAEQLQSALGRALERSEPTVLALGGGTYAQPANAELLRSAAVSVVWLDCSPGVLFARCLTMTGRPLFRDEASFRALYAQRLPSYQQAEFRVDSSREPASVVADILALGIAAPRRDAHLIVEPRPS